MAYEHLPLLPHTYELLRRKNPGFSFPVKVNPKDHGTQLAQQIGTLLQDFQLEKNKLSPVGINPSLILKVEIEDKTALTENDLKSCGFRLLDEQNRKNLFLFASDSELKGFLSKLDDFKQGKKRKDDQKAVNYYSLFSKIISVSVISPEDRIGSVLKERDIKDNDNYIVDVELWHTGDNKECAKKIAEIKKFIVKQEGRVTDDWLDRSLCLLRAHVKGRVLKLLITFPDIAGIELPPTPNLIASKAFIFQLSDAKQIKDLPKDSPAVCVIDSGITPGHPLLEKAVGDAIPILTASESPYDENGHGTMVAGFATYDDLESSIESKIFSPITQIFSARVLNDRAEFDDEKLITTQMREAIKYFVDKYKCRVFNVSLGDSKHPINDRASAWATILDALSRELKVLIVVSSGNYSHPEPREAPAQYPRYLSDPSARIIWPAEASIAVTVGALTSSPTTRIDRQDVPIELRPIANIGEPAPFSRSGPGINRAVKPEFCEFGGNAYFHATNQGLESKLIGEIGLNHNYRERLFSRDSGSSYSAPKLALKAGQIMKRYPDFSPNLVRAIMASAASHTSETISLAKRGNEPDLPERLCGYGVVDLAKAIESQENRVTLFDQSSLPFDKFRIYEVPIIPEFTKTSGNRELTVSLAYDPYVRNTRMEHLSVSMYFSLFRGNREIEEIIDSFRAKKTSKEELHSIRQREVPFDRKPSIRDNGTLQKATWHFKNNFNNRYSDTFYLVVVCQRNWGDENGKQDFGVVVTMSHSSQQIRLYESIRQRVQQRVRARV